MKSLLACLPLLLLGAFASAQAPASTPPPPQVIVVHDAAPTQTIESRITAWGTAATLAIATLSGLVALALQKYAALKPEIEAVQKRQDRQGAKADDLQKQLTTVALATPPASPPLPSVTGSSSTVAPLIALALLLPLALTGCLTDTGNATRDRNGRVTNAVADTAVRAVGRIALASLVDVVTSQASGQKIDLAHSAAAGLWSQAGSIFTSGDVQRIVAAYAGSQLPAVATAAASAFAKADPQTPAARVAVINSLAQTISTAAFNATGNP